MTLVSLFPPVRVRLLFWKGAALCFCGPGAGPPAESFPSHPSVLTGERVGRLPVLFQQFYTLTSLQTGAFSGVAAADGGPACVSAAFTFCDHLLLSHANTKATLKPRHLAWIRCGLSEPCKCQQDTHHSAAWLPWRQHTWQLPRTMGCCGATEMRDDREVPLADRWTPALEDKSSETWVETEKWCVWWRMWGDEIRKYHKEQKRHVWWMERLNL